MKVKIVQPYYSLDGKKDVFDCYKGMLSLMDSIDKADLIILPESCHTPANMGNAKSSFEIREELAEDFDKKVKALAKRTGALVFANYGEKLNGKYQNITYGINKNGEIVAKYYKAHPAPSEIADKYMDNQYSYQFNEPYVVDIDGIRYGFMTCYDFYMYESFAPLARKNVDIIIGCSHQRSDTHQALEIIGRFLSYNTNAYLLRSSISLGEDSPICGSSMAVAPDGTMLENMKSKIGILEIDIDPKKKYYKKKGFYGTELVSHYEYIEDGRRPWLYRPGGSAMCEQDQFMTYPRVCAHRGYNSIAPENSMIAFGSAIGLGAKEIEFDLWQTKDGEIVSSHDPTLERTSDGTGLITDYTLEELQKLDFGIKCGEKFKGLKIITFEQILKKFSCHAIMNIHVKKCDDGRTRDRAEKIVNLIKKYDCEQHCYIMTNDLEMHKILREIAPWLTRCMGAKYGGDGKDHLQIVDEAIKYGCKKVQFYQPYLENFSKEEIVGAIKRAHDNNLICNYFFADDIDEAIEYIDMGMDTILTNDYLRIKNAIEKHLKEKV